MGGVRIGIYNPHLMALGGGEKYTLLLAEALSEKYVLDYVTLTPVKREFLEDRYRIGLRNINFVPLLPNKKILSICQKARFGYSFFLLNSRLRTNKYHIFIQNIVSLNDMIPPPDKNVLLIQGISESFESDLKFTKTSFTRHQLMIVNSQHIKDLVISKKVLSHKIEILYPPTDCTTFQPLKKRKTILVAGRLKPDKGFAQAVDIFKELSSLHEQGWNLHLALITQGGEESRELLSEIRAKAKNYPIYIHLNCSASTLRVLYGEASIFWHRAGCGGNEAFGMVITEAMSAGAVPLSLNQGGPREIIEHGKNGFLFNTLDELAMFTMLLVSNQSLWEKMSRLAVERSKAFSYESFRDRTFEIAREFF